MGVRVVLSMRASVPRVIRLVTCWYAVDKLQGFIPLVARVGSSDPVRVLHLYTTITLDEVCSIYC